MDEKVKRSRVQNFEANEIDILVELVERKKSIIECKKTDATTSKTKDAEWEKAANVFNAQSSVLRTASQLRSKWESLKKVTKKYVSEEKLNVYKTGGGKSSNKIKPPWADRILSIIKIGAMGFNSNHDCDDEVCVNEEEYDTEPIVHIKSTPVILEEALEEIETQVDWSSWTPEALRKPPHPSLKRLINVDQIVDENGSNQNIKNSPLSSEKSIPSTSKIYPTRKKAKRSLAASTNQHFSDLALKKLELVNLQLKHARELFELEKEALQTKIDLNKKKIKSTVK